MLILAHCNVTSTCRPFQNNGVIAVTRCANRTAGRFCCFFLILFGVLGKISGVFLASTSAVHLSLLARHSSSWCAVPDPVLGGVTTFLFASVAVSGVRVLSYTRFTRRDRFVLAAALSFGIGDLLVPDVFTYLFDSVQHPNKGLQGLFNSITIILSTPCECLLLCVVRMWALMQTAVPSPCRRHCCGSA